MGKHPDYKLTTRNVFNDIALVRLPSAATLNVAVQPVCLPLNSVTAAAELKVSDLQTGLEGTWPHVVGWGYTDPLSREGCQGSFSTQLSSAKAGGSCEE